LDVEYLLLVVVGVGFPPRLKPWASSLHLCETRDEDLANLDDVIDAVENDAGRPPTDEELRAAGIDPEDNRQAGTGELPDLLK
jgi:hypothetical protein